jgi:hypothetical protein
MFLRLAFENVYRDSSNVLGWAFEYAFQSIGLFMNKYAGRERESAKELSHYLSDWIIHEGLNFGVRLIKLFITVHQTLPTPDNPYTCYFLYT